MKHLQKNQAVFLDRDGTLNVDKGYIYKIVDFELLPNVVETLQAFQRLGYIIVIITNQSGIARGYYTEEDYLKLTKWINDMLEDKGVHIRGTYYCPHHPNAVIEKYRCNCSCRKPATKLFYQAAKDLEIDIDRSVAIGDKLRDCMIAEQSLCRGYLVGNNEDKAIIHDVKSGKYQRIQFAGTINEVLELMLEEGK